MKLTKLIFDYWKIWMSIPEKDNIWANAVGFVYADGWYGTTFWWILNKEWYKMNSKMYSYTGCVEPYVEPPDFEEISSGWREMYLEDY